jgi:hypothetical protein
MAGGHVDAIYYCPHDCDAGCWCCKPKPGFLCEAQRDFSLDLTRTCFVGDDDRDAQAADVCFLWWIRSDVPPCAKHRTISPNCRSTLKSTGLT